MFFCSGCGAELAAAANSTVAAREGRELCAACAATSAADGAGEAGGARGGEEEGDPLLAPPPRLRTLRNRKGSPTEEAEEWRARIEAHAAWNAVHGRPRVAALHSLHMLLATEDFDVRVLRDAAGSAHRRGEDGASRFVAAPKKRSKSRIVKAVTWDLDYHTRGFWHVPGPLGADLFGPPLVDSTVCSPGVARAPPPDFEPFEGEIRFARELRSSAEYPQKQALRAIRDHHDWCVERRLPACGLLQTPPGSGKTTMAWAYAVHRVLRHGGRVAFVSGREDLVYQIIGEGHECCAGDLRTGVAMASTLQVDPERYNVVSFSAATLASHAKRKGRAAAVADLHTHTFDLLVWDEAHHVVSPGNLDALRLFNCRYNLFLSATVDRDDGLRQELRDVCGPVLYRGNAAVGALNILAVQYDVERDVPKDFTGEINFNGLLSLIVDDEARNEWGCRVIAQMVRAGHTVLVMTLRAASQIPGIVRRLHELLADYEGDRHEFTYDGTTYGGPLLACTMSEPSFADVKDAEERREKRAGFRASIAEMNALPSTLAINSSRKGRDVPLRRTFMKYARVIVGHTTNFSEGFNAPQLSCLFMFGAFKGESSTVQSANRVTRRYAGKAVSYMVDLADDITGCRIMLNAQRERYTTLRSVMDAEVSVRRIAAGTLPSSHFWADAEEMFEARAAARRGAGRLSSAVHGAKTKGNTTKGGARGGARGGAKKRGWRAAEDGEELSEGEAAAQRPRTDIPALPTLGAGDVPSD